MQQTQIQLCKRHLIEVPIFIAREDKSQNFYRCKTCFYLFPVGNSQLPPSNSFKTQTAELIFGDNINSGVYFLIMIWNVTEIVHLILMIPNGWRGGRRNQLNKPVPKFGIMKRIFQGIKRRRGFSHFTTLPKLIIMEQREAGIAESGNRRLRKVDQRPR